jgi:glycosyltransferase involved in cell wall biosynthesis
MRPTAFIYNEFLETLGGGERYVLALAEELRSQYDVVVGAPRLPDPARVEHFGLSTAGISLVQCDEPSVIRTSQRPDLFIGLWNSLPPVPPGHHNVGIVQFPFDSLPDYRHVRSHIRARRCLATYDRFIVYSEFVQQWLRRRWRVSADVVYPPVELGSYAATAKERLVVSVGRFFPGPHNKRHDVVLDAFRQASQEMGPGWKLALIGGLGHEAGSYRVVEELRATASSIDNVEIVVDASRAVLSDCLRRASFYVHATGYGRSQDRPEHAEHFGISTVEAMSYGCVPLVFRDGGQPEIVSETCGVTWTTVPGLVDALTSLANAPVRRERLAAESHRTACHYGRDTFREAVEERFFRR